jgi:hypothetical protein
MKHWLMTRPFPHLLLEDVLSEGLPSKILSFLEGVAWKHNRGSFFEFQEILNGSDLHSLRSTLASTNMEALVRFELENSLQIPLSNPLYFGVQKYAQHSGISSHTDADVKAVRFILNLNRGWSPRDGGIWLLAENYELWPDPEFVIPKNNFGFAFVPGTQTFHALSERISSESYAIILEFPWRQTKPINIPRLA